MSIFSSEFEHLKNEHSLYQYLLTLLPTSKLIKDGKQALVVNSDEFISTIELLKQKFKACFFDFFSINKQNDKSVFVLQLLLPASEFIVEIQSDYDKNINYDKLKKIFANLTCHECLDSNESNFNHVGNNSDNDNAKLITSTLFPRYMDQSDFDSLFWVNLGPFSKSTRGRYRVLAELDDRKVSRVLFESGYNSGLDLSKIEGNHPLKVIPSLSRLSPFDSFSLPFAFVKACENAFGIEVKKDVTYWRVFIHEISRVLTYLKILNEFFDNNNAYRFAEDTANFYHQISSLFSRKILGDYLTIGGLRSVDIINSTLPPLSLLKDFLDNFSKFYTFFRKSYFFKKIDSSSIFNRKDIMNSSCFGIVGRSMGINIDQRTSEYYKLGLKDNFSPVLGINGSQRNSVILIFEEILQSLNMSISLVDYARPDELNSVEEENFHLSVVNNELHLGDKKIFGSHMGSVESPFGAMSVNLSFSGPETIKSFSIRSPSKMTFSLYEKKSKDLKFDDLDQLLTLPLFDPYEIDW